MIIEAGEVFMALEANEVIESFKLVLTLQYSTLMINNSLYSCLERNLKNSKIMTQHFGFVTFYFRGCRGHSMGAKSILKVISQISASRQHVNTPFITKL